MKHIYVYNESNISRLFSTTRKEVNDIIFDSNDNISIIDKEKSKFELDNNTDSPSNVDENFNNDNISHPPFFMNNIKTMFQCGDIVRLPWCLILFYGCCNSRRSQDYIQNIRKKMQVFFFC